MNLHNETRGFRNNNPGNIRHGEKWYGLAEKQTDPDFCQFVSVEYGIRAIFKTLETYREKYGLKTVREIITRWAPPSENDTEAYIKNVEEQVDLTGDLLGFSVSNFVRSIPVVAAIIKHENGIIPFTENFIRQCKDIE